VWRRQWRARILAPLHRFNPDLILVSAGFDGHRCDEVNYGFLGLDDADYAWVTREIVKVANSCCHGRVVSVLEGGYRIHGKLVSPFGRSVAAHVRELAHATHEPWTPQDAAFESRKEGEAMEREARAREEEYQAWVARRTAQLEEVRQQELAQAQAAAAAVAAPAAPAAADAADAAPVAIAPAVAAAPPAAPVAAAPGAAAAAPAAGGGRRKRRRGAAPVDYVALNAQLDAEASQPAAKRPNTNEGPQQ